MPFHPHPFFQIQMNIMKKYLQYSILALGICISSCNNEKKADNTGAGIDAPVATVQDDVSQKDVVKVAMGSPDHTTLVAAVKQADLVTSLSNAGPFTVFAPTNAAFDKLPAGTVDGLMKDDKKADLQDILKTDYLTDGMNIGMVNGGNITVSIKDGKIMLNGTATIIASVPASNGIVHVIDAVLVPPAK